MKNKKENWWLVQGWPPSVAKALCGILLLSASFQTQSASIEDVSINGFLSQGYIKSSENNYVAGSKQGSWEFHEIGLTFGIDVNEDLRAGVQLYSRDFGDFSNDDFEIDWALVDYTYRNWLGARIGKIKLPYGFYNKTRDVDAVRTSVLLPQTVYMESVREFVFALDGFELYGNVELGGAGDLDYEVFTGVFNFDTTAASSSILKNVLVAFQIQLGANPAAGTLIQQFGSAVSNSSFRVDHADGGALIWNTGVEGLRTGVSTLVMQGSLETDPSVPISLDLEVEEMFVASIEYETGDYLFTAEQFSTETAFITNITGVGTLELNWEGWYLAASKALNDKFDVGLSYGEFYSNSKDKDGDLFVAIGQPDYLAWQKETTLSLSYMPNDNWMIKLEYRDISGVAQSTDLGLTGSLEENWDAIAIKSSVSF